MLLTKQQEFYLRTVQEFRCLRFDQLHTLLRTKFHIPGVEDVNATHMAAMLRQLRYGNWRICAESGFVFIDGEGPNARLLEAIDIMLELTGGAPLDFQVSHRGPVLLQFSIEAELLRLFSVAELSAVARPPDIERRKMERIIWISESGRLPDLLELPSKQFFAIRQEDGTHRFYGSAEP